MKIINKNRSSGNIVKHFYMLILIFLITIFSSALIFANGSDPADTTDGGGGGAGGGSGDSSQNPPQTRSSTPSVPPSNAVGIYVVIDVDSDELYNFRWDSNIQGCGIEVEEEDGFFGKGPWAKNDKEKFYGTRGGIIRHNGGSLNDAVNACYSGGDNPCGVLRYNFRSMRCNDNCPLGSYKPAGDILCGYDGKWYMCDSSFHGGNGKFFLMGGDKGYICTKGNEWKPAEICTNPADEDGDGKVNCLDENCYGTSKELISEPDQTKIGEHIIDFQASKKAYYHESCNPDSQKQAPEQKFDEVCKATSIPVAAGQTAVTKKPYDYFPILFSSTPPNRCCGDDITDCGKTESPAPPSANSQALCNIDTSAGATVFSKWIRSDGESDAEGNGAGNIKHVKCNGFEYLSDGIKWIKCDGVFENSNNAIDKRIIKVGTHDYVCIGKGNKDGKGSIVECCGNSACQSKDTSSGQRLDSGKKVDTDTFQNGTTVSIGGSDSSPTPSPTPSPSPAPSFCTTRTDCPNGWWCINSECVECYGDAFGCPSGKTCNQNTHRCQTTLGGPAVIAAITGYAAAPNRLADVQSLAQGKTPICSEADRGAFTDLVATTLAQSDNRWGRKSILNGPISTDTLGYRVDTPGRVIAVDIINGVTGQPQWLDEGEVAGNWYPPSGTSSFGSLGTSGGTYYCNADGRFSRNSIGGGTDHGTGGCVPSSGANKDACEKAGFKWTGSKCCGEPEDRPEYYNDGITATATGCGGSCDAPTLALKYQRDVENAIREAGDVDVSSESGIDSYLNTVVENLKFRGFIGVAHAINCNGNPSKDSIIIGKSSDQYAEYYDIVLGAGSGNPRPGIGYTQPADWKRCSGCGKTSPDFCTRLRDSPDVASSGLGGCWNSKAVMSVSFVENTQNSVLNFRGVFHGCAIDKGNYNKENDGLLGIKDFFTKAQLIVNHDYCYNLPDKSYYCSYKEKWELTNGANKTHLSAAPVSNPNQTAECCSQTECWSGSACIVNQKGNPLSQPIGGFRCIDGEWKNSTLKFTPDEDASGYCPEEQQCLLNPLAKELKDQCLEPDQYVSDHYCENGVWSSRTKILALKLLKLKIGDYAVFCDDKDNTLNNILYLVDSRNTASSFLSNLQANNFCILKNGNRVIAATSINKNLDNVSAGTLNVFGIQNCNIAINDSQYHNCDASKRVWYNKNLKSFIFSSAPIEIPSDQEASSTILNIFRSIIDAIKRLIEIPPLDQSYLTGLKKFSKLYMEQKGSKTIMATLEGKGFKNLVVEYRDVNTDICKYVDLYTQNKTDVSSGLVCKKEGNNFYVLAQGSKLTNVDPDMIWTDMTSKLRLK